MRGPQLMPGVSSQQSHLAQPCLFLRFAQYAFMRSPNAFLSAAVKGRRFLFTAAGLWLAGKEATVDDAVVIASGFRGGRPRRFVRP